MNGDRPLGVPLTPIYVLARTALWGKRFARAMGWQEQEVRYITNAKQLDSIGRGAMVFELAGWTDTRSLSDVNEIADKLLFKKRAGLQICFVNTDNLTW